MDTIQPLLRFDPGEVLINFMTGHIRRFPDSSEEQTLESFRRLFGSDAIRHKVQGLTGQDREDAAIEEYGRSVQTVGAFTYMCSAIVLHPEIDRTQFHLIYATRSQKGVQVFKEAEKKARRFKKERAPKHSIGAVSRRRASRPFQAARSCTIRPAGARVVDRAHRGGRGWTTDRDESRDARRLLLGAVPAGSPGPG